MRPELQNAVINKLAACGCGRNKKAVCTCGAMKKEEKCKKRCSTKQSKCAGLQYKIAEKLVKDERSDAGIGTYLANSLDDDRKPINPKAYFPQQLMRAKHEGLVPPRVKKWSLYSEPFALYSNDMLVEGDRPYQSCRAAEEFFLPRKSTSFNTLYDAFMRFGAENLEYYKKKGVLPPLDMEREWTPEEQMLLDNMTPEDRAKAMQQPNVMVRNDKQNGQYKVSSLDLSSLMLNMASSGYMNKRAALNYLYKEAGNR